jgi:hypothetical protein
MSDKQKIQKIREYLQVTRKELDKAIDADDEYSTSQGNGVNPCEASAMFREVEEEIGKILAA